MKKIANLREEIQGLLKPEESGYLGRTLKLRYWVHVKGAERSFLVKKIEGLGDASNPVLSLTLDFDTPLITDGGATIRKSDVEVGQVHVWPFLKESESDE